jgi:mycothiol synthase
LPDTVDSGVRDALMQLDAAVCAATTWAPFGEGVWRDLVSPGRGSFAALTLEQNMPLAAVYASESEKVWSLGLGALPGHLPPLAEALSKIAGLGAEQITAWVLNSDDTTSLAVSQLLSTSGFVEASRLLRLEVSLPVEALSLPSGFALRAFDEERDSQSWLETNNRCFVGHPEQGNWSMEKFRNRRAEAWFRSEDLLVAHLDDIFVGFCWTKTSIETARPPIGEIYVIAVAPEFGGRGIGSALCSQGLAHLEKKHHSEIGMLYVDASNEAAIKTYDKLGLKSVREDRAWTWSL